MISSEHKPVIKKIESRDMRDSAWRALGQWMTEKDWYSVLNTESCEDKFRLLMMELTSAIDSFLPRKVVKKHTTDRPWISKKLKSWIRKRQSAFLRHGRDSSNYKFWRNKVQGEVKKAKNHYCHDKVAQVESTNSSKWWRQVKSLHAETLSRSDTINFLGMPWIPNYLQIRLMTFCKSYRPIYTFDQWFSPKPSTTGTFGLQRGSVPIPDV